MIAQEDYNFITAYEATKSKQDRDTLLESNKNQCARTMINFITTVAKDQNVRYVLTVLDDMLQVCQFLNIIDRKDFKYEYVNMNIF